MPSTRTQWDGHPRLIWQMLGDQSVILVRGTAGIWTPACLPLYPGPCLYLSCLCLFLGQDRKRPQAMRPSVLQVSSMLALVLPPSRQSSRRQKDKAARVGTPAKGRCGAGRPAGRGQVSGQTSWGLLACWATLRKPEHIRPQEFPGPVLAQQQWEKTYSLQSPCWNSRRKTPAIWDLLPGLGGCWPVLSLLPASRASSSVCGGGVRNDGSRSLPDLKAPNLWHFLT